MPVGTASKSGSKTKAQDAYLRIKQGLLQGMFKPGERLVETKICESFGFRRGPVREALQLLHGEGFIRKDGAYKGHVVEFTEDIPPEQLLHRYELREQIAGGACRLAAKNMNGWQIDVLRDLALKLDPSLESSDRQAIYEANFAFHEFLLDNCGNSLLREVWEAHHLMPPQPRSRQLEDEILGNLPDRNQPSLVEVVQAIALHDQGEAEARMKSRVRKITEALRKTVQKMSMGSIAAQ
jgi:DNA-binding GntR family transcriptional regulator